jgi:endogenous inhibitor of DNA gyrase (YacG/DUF329 family)
MAEISERQCPECGNVVPSELGQHAESLVSGSVTCPHCGASVTLGEGAADESGGDVERAASAPPGRSEKTETFSGQETAEGLADELKHKPT